MNRKFWAPVIFLVSLLFVFIFLTYRLIFKSLPVCEDSLQVAGLAEISEIEYDKSGVPNITANSVQDMYFAMGFSHAHDRLWQMDLLRRAATGRLTEILGTSCLEIDTAIIKFDFTSLAENLFTYLPDSIQKLLEAYSNGINAFIHHQQAAPAVEFQLLNYTPKEWHPIHTLAIWRLWGWLNSNIRYELRDFIFARQIPEAALKIFNIRSENQVSGASRKYFPEKSYKILHVIKKLDELTGFPIASEFSLSRLWMEHTSSAPTPFLTFSPLATLTIPNIWYLLQTKVKGASIQGATIPGIPVIFGGTNGYISWSCDPIMAHNSHFEVDALPSELKNIPDFQSKMQFVPISDRDTLWISTRTKNRQPILFETRGANSPQYFLTCHWTGANPDSLFLNLLNIGGIHSSGQIKSILPRLSTPAIQFCALDNNDMAVFYRFGASFLPVNRKKVKRSEAANEIGLYEFKPFLNAVAAESLPVKSSYLNFKTDSILNLEPVFGRKIWQILDKAKQNPDSADLYKFAFIRQNLTNRFSSAAVQILPLLIDYLEKLPDQIDAKEVIYLLKQWDFHEHAHSYAATVFNLMMEELTFDIFHDEMGDSLYSVFVQFPELVNHALSALFCEPENIWFDISETDSVKETLPNLLVSVIPRIYLAENGHDSIPNLLWKSRTPYRISHLLAERKSKDILLNSETIYLQGNGFPINYISQIAKPFSPVKGWPLQLIFMPADPMKTFWTMSTGQSGHILSPNYKNLTKSWLEGQFNTFEFSPNQLDEKNKIIIMPRQINGKDQ